MHIKSGLLLVAALVLLIMPAYANVLETSLALRDKLPASTLANISDFVARMAAVGSSVTYGPQGYYAVYNADDLRGIFGDDAVIIPSGGIVQITYNRGGTFRYFGALHGTIVADSARKAITITKGGFISPEDVNVNIAGSEIVIDARNPAKAAFKISRDGVYVQNKYFLGCEPEQEANEEDCMYEKCECYETCEECAECDLTEMEQYKEDIEKYNYCALSALVAPQYAYANITGTGLLSESALIKDYKTQEYKEFRSETVYDAEAILINPGDLRNMQIGNGADLKFTANAPYGGIIDSISLKSGELFKYSRKDNLKYISGDRLEIYNYGLPWDIVVTAEDVGNSPHSESMIRIFDGNMEESDTPWMMEIKKGSLHFTEGTSCPVETGAFCFYKRTDFDEFGGISYYYDALGGMSYYYQLQMLPKREKPLVVDINAETLSLNIITMERINVLISIGPFSNADTSSKVRLVNNAGTAIEFTSSDITLSPPDKSWTDLGVSFKGYIHAEEGIPSVGEDILECRYNEGKCYLNGAEALGFIGGRAQRNRLCSNDEECGSDRKCMEGLCVTKATCESVGEANVGINGISGRATFVSGFAGRNKANVIFISDEYGSKEQFDSDIQKVISTSESSNGIFSVEPFKSSIGKFKFYSAFGGSAPSEMVDRMGRAPWERYVNGIVKQCASAEYAIVLTQKNFRSFAQSWRTGIAEKGSAWVSVGADREDYPIVALHEFGHAFGDLRDEYHSRIGGRQGVPGMPNCLSKSEALDKWKEWPDVLAEAELEKWKGCGGDCDETCANMIRPSEDSIMNTGAEWMDRRNEPGWKAFNPPSETQLIEKLNAYS